MERLQIETAQNVTVEHALASVGDRGLAYFYDLLIQITWIIVALWSLGMLDINADWIFMVVGFLPVFLYHLVCELTMNGQSVGKRARQIQVARIDGKRPTIGQYLLRWVLRSIDSFYMIGLVVILVNGKGQRLGDLAAGTTVISLKKRLKLSDTMLVDVQDDHVPMYRDAALLNDQQALLIKEVLYKNKGDNRWTLVEEMAEKVKEVLQVEYTERPGEFLEHVLRDYVFLTSR